MICHCERPKGVGSSFPTKYGESKWTPAFAGVTGLVALFLFACKPLPPPQPPLVQTVAVLPFDNESNDINAPEIVQSYVYWALKSSPYQVRDIKETNEHLAKNGVVDGGQLPIMDPVKIAKDLGVQALLYGYISDFGYINVGYYRSRKVGLGLKIVDGTTGQTLWEHDGTGRSMKFAASAEEAKAEFAKGLADQLADKIFKSPLEEEAKLAVQNALTTLPGFRFCGFQNTPGKANPVKNVIRDRINQ